MTSHDSSYSLFLDSCDGFKLGILNQDYEWVSYQAFEEKKASNILFDETNKVLEKLGIALENLQNLFLALGPGSYTGVRLLQGVKELYSEMGLNVFSFYLFEIPFLAQIPQGQFLVSAYKGEFYHYEWSGEKNSQKLLNQQDRDQIDEFYSTTDILGVGPAKNVYKVLAQSAPVIFRNIVRNNLRRDSFYFRPLEKEFKANFPELKND